MATILVIRQAHYPHDPRVRQEVYALLDAGHEVDVVCTRGAGEAPVERLGRLRIFRVPLYHRRGGVAGYVLEYLLFFVSALVIGGVLHIRRRYRLVQVNTLPDVLIFASAVPRLFGARVLLDLHECMPEFFATKFGVAPDHPVVRLLAAIEQAAIRYADHSITCTDQMRAVFCSRGAAASAVDVILNSADESVFDPDLHAARRPDGKFVLICHGAIEKRYGHQTALRALAHLAEDLPGLRLAIYGDGSELPRIRELARELGVEERVHFSGGYVPLDDLVAAIARADAGLVAMTRDRFRDLTQCTKMYDYIAMRIPVVCSRTASVEAYFDEDCFAWFESDDEHDLVRAIRMVHDSPRRRVELVRRTRLRAEPYRWRHQREAYLALVERLLAS
jgi:glycosyltransferase involved in cell wall biosynthesis